MKDFLGQELEVGDHIASIESDNESPTLSVVTGFTPKKVRLRPIHDEEATGLRFPTQVFKIDATEMFAKLLYTAEDKIGQELEVGDYVFASDGSYIDPVLYTITELLPFKVRVKRLDNEHDCRNTRYNNDVLKVDPHFVTIHALKKTY